ncbi:MAG: uracil/xanthine transporter [Peptococcaceae bacterium]|nr:uracil/xanthine transporter [Peptococcaceae bacterium]
MRRTAIVLAGVQWLLFMFANTVVIPLSVGAAFHLSSALIMTTLRLSFMYTGLACILQAVIGHRYPVLEGQAGLWWGVILSLSGSAVAAHLSLTQLGGGLATGIMLSGVSVAVLGALGMGKLLQRLFTPVIMSVFLFLLGTQLLIIFAKGMLGLSNGASINLPVAALSVCLVVLVACLTVKGRGPLRNFAILLGIVVGWIVFVLLFPQHTVWVAQPGPLLNWFPWGTPNWDLGIVLTAYLTGLINTANTVVSLRGMEPICGEAVNDAKYRRSFVLTGFNTFVAGTLGLVPYAPYTSSLGFLQVTGILDRAPFILGGVMFVGLGMMPTLGSFFATLPISVGDAVLFVAYLQLIGAALRQLEGIGFNPQQVYRYALPLLSGIVIMSLPAQAFNSLPMLARPLVSNGLLMGIILALILDNVVSWERIR